jgi:hypothetical protein
VQGGDVRNTVGQLSLRSGSSSNVFIDPASGTTVNDGHLALGQTNTNAILTTNGTGDLTINTNNGSNSGSIVIADGVNGNITLTTNGTGKVIVAGDLQVDGTTTTINSTTLDVDDINITIAKGAANAAAANGGGITLEGPATAATITYASADDSWNLNKKTSVPELQVDNININDNTISSIDTDGNIILSPNGSGLVEATASLLAPAVSTPVYYVEDLAGDQTVATIARSVTTTSTDITTLTATNRKGMKIMLIADDDTDTHMIEALVMRDAGETSGAQVTFYGELKTGASLATFTADYDSGTSVIRLRATPASAASTTFKVVRTALF